MASNEDEEAIANLHTRLIVSAPIPLDEVRVLMRVYLAQAKELAEANAVLHDRLEESGIDELRAQMAKMEIVQTAAVEKAQTINAELMRTIDNLRRKYGEDGQWRSISAGILGAPGRGGWR